MQILLSFLFLFLACRVGFSQDIPFDYLIKEATVYDGVSFKPFKGDVGIRGERIEKMGDLTGYSAIETIEAKNLVLAPGFIDAHTHSDFNPLVYPKIHNKLLQGVTTEIVGSCGMSAAPVIGRHQEQVAGVWPPSSLRRHACSSIPM